MSQRDLWDGMALLARWFRFQPGEIDELTPDEFASWLDAACDQIRNERRG